MRCTSWIAPRLSSAFMEMTLSLAQQGPLVFQHKFFSSERYAFAWFVEHDHPLLTFKDCKGNNFLVQEQWIISGNSCGDDGHLPRHRHAVVLEIPEVTLVTMTLNLMYGILAQTWEQFLHFYLHFSPLPFVERFFSRRLYLSFDLKCKWFLFRWQLAPAGICFVGVACCSKDPQSLIFSECVYDEFMMIQIPRISISVMFGDILFYVYIVTYIHFRCRFLRIPLLLPWLSGSETESFSIVRKRR